MNSNEFLESLRNPNGDVSLELRAEIIAVLKRKKSIKEVCDFHKGHKGFPQDPKGLKRAMRSLIEQDDEVRQLYIEYKAGKNDKPRGYEYIPEIIYMLENDLSQRDVSAELRIPRETLKTAMSRVQDEKLKRLIEVHTSRHSLGRNFPGITEEEKENILAYKQEYLSKNAISTDGKNNEKEETGERE